MWNRAAFRKFTVFSDKYTASNFRVQKQAKNMLYSIILGRITKIHLLQVAFRDLLKHFEVKEYSEIDSPLWIDHSVLCNL
jgi:hypothetical protein